MRTVERLDEELGRLDWLSAHPLLRGEDQSFARGAAIALTWAHGTVKRQISPADAITQEAIRQATKRKVPHCRKCGCVQEFACNGGCAWAVHPTKAKPGGLCTACAKSFARRPTRPRAKNTCPN